MGDLGPPGLPGYITGQGLRVPGINYFFWTLLLNLYTRVYYLYQRILLSSTGPPGNRGENGFPGQVGAIGPQGLPGYDGLPGTSFNIRGGNYSLHLLFKLHNIV